MCCMSLGFMDQGRGQEKVEGSTGVFLTSGLHLRSGFAPATGTRVYSLTNFELLATQPCLPRHGALPTAKLLSSPLLLPCLLTPAAAPLLRG